MRRATPFVLLCAWGASLCGCDYFKPAQPEAPSDRVTFIPNYSQPDSTLATIARAIVDKGITIGGSAYADAFANPATAGAIGGYHQLFDPSDVSAWEDVSKRQAPTDWVYNQEQSFYNRFIRIRPDHYDCTWTEDPQNPDSVGTNDFVKISRHYLVVSRADDGTQTSFIAIGFADLYMFHFPDGVWRIVLWKDRRDTHANNSGDQVTLGFRRMDTSP